MNIKKLFGLQTQAEKIKEYKDALRGLSSIEKETEKLAEIYSLQKSQYDDLSNNEDLDIRAEAANRYQEFVKSHVNDISSLRQKKLTFEKSIESIEKDEELKEITKEIKDINSIYQKCQKGELKKSVFFDLLKAKTGKTRFADVLLFRGSKLLILQRAGDGGSYTDKWCVPGGHVDPGETFIEAAVRELYEETGIELDEGCMMEVGTYNVKGTEIHYFMTHISDDAPSLIMVDGMEEIGSAWIDPNTEIEDYDFIFDMKDNLKRILGIQVNDFVAPILKAYTNGELSEEDFKDWALQNKEAIEKSENKKYFSHKERKDLAGKGEAMPNGKYPIRNSQDLHDAIRLVGASSMPESEVKAWIKKRANELGLADELPESWEGVEKSELEDVDELEKSGKTLPVGTIKNYNGKEYEKTVQGWKPKKNGPKTVTKEDLDRAKEFGRKSKTSAPYEDEAFMSFQRSLGKVSDSQKVKLLNAYNDGKKEIEKAEGVEDVEILAKESLDGDTKNVVVLPEGESKDLEKARKPTKIITIECRDTEGNLEKMIETIKSMGNVGHSFSIIVDPDSPKSQGGNVEFGWDGDGADWIGDIKIKNKDDVEKSISNIEGFGLNIKFNDLEEAQMFKSLVEEWNNEGKINIQSVEEENVPFEKSLNNDKRTFNLYLNFIEGVKTRLKNIHWNEEDNSKHVYLDELSDEVVEFEDKIAEAGQSGFGRFKDGEIEGEEIEESDPIKICQMIFDRTIEFRRMLEGNDIYNGEISWIDDFLASLKQTKYRLQMH